MDNWYYKLFGDEFGPVTFDALVDLAKAETLAPDDEVRFGENGPWRRAGSMGQLMAHMPAGAHMPSVSSSGSMPAIQSKNSGASSQKSDEPSGWYYQSFGEQFGPMSFDDLVVLAKNQTLSADDEVKFGETGTWRRAGSIGQLMAHLPFQAKKNAFSIELEPTTAESTSEQTDELDDPLIDMRVLESQTPPPATKAATGGKKASSASMKTVSPPSAPAEPVAPAAPKEELWWCMISGKEYGPVELPKLVAWAAAGRLLRNDFVRCGLDPYVVAGELPGLFPELPPSAVVAETKPEIKAVTRAMPTPSPAAASPAVAPTPEADPSAPVSKPVTNWQANSAPAAGGGFNRPAAPIRRPPSKGGSGSMQKLIVPIGGGVGALLLAVLIYFAIPYLPLGDSADQKNFKALRAAFAEFHKVGSGENPNEDELKKAAEAMAKAAKKVDPALKAKTPAAARLKSLSKKLQDTSKEDAKKIVEADKALAKQIDTLAKSLKVK